MVNEHLGHQHARSVNDDLTPRIAGAADWCVVQITTIAAVRAGATKAGAAAAATTTVVARVDRIRSVPSARAAAAKVVVVRAP